VIMRRLELTCRILRHCELDEGPKSKAANDRDDETNAEHGHDLDLLLRRHIQLGEHRQWQSQDDEIQEDLDCAPNEAEQTDVDATVAFDLTTPAVPEKHSCGSALEDHGEDVCDAKASDDADEHPHDLAQPLFDHDTKVEGKNRQLTQAFCEHVHEVGNVEPLQALGDVVRRYAPHVAAETETSCDDDWNIHSERHELLVESTLNSRMEEKRRGISLTPESPMSKSSQPSCACAEIARSVIRIMTINNARLPMDAATAMSVALWSRMGMPHAA
jgi:hypothetical protein